MNLAWISLAALIIAITLSMVTSVNVGVVSLARLAAAPIVPFTVLPRGPRRWVVTIERQIEPPDRERGRYGEQAVLQLLADRWTETVRRHPEHWAASFPIEWRDG